MKRFVIIACCIVLCASWASAEVGALCVYTDEAGTNCSFVDNGGLVQVYIIHQYADGVSASQFKLDVSATGWTHLGDTWNFPLVIGSSINGVSVGYGGCESSPFMVGVASFMGSSAPANTMFGIIADPSVGEIQAVDCENYTRVSAGGTAWVNSASSCVCETNQVPELEVDPPSIDFGYIDVTRELTVTNRGGGTLTWNLSESEDWLSLSTAGGTDRQTVTLTVDRTGLGPGTRSGTINVTSNGGDRAVSVMMTVVSNDPILRVHPTALNFGEHLETGTLSVFNDGVDDLEWSISSDQPWLTVSPASGINNGQVTVTVDRSGLSQSVYTGTLSIVSNGGNETATVEMWVGAPVLQIDPTSLIFGNSEESLPLYIYNAGAGGLTWSITSDQPWLTVTPASGVDGGQVTVTVDRTGLALGLYYGNLSVTSNGGTATVTVAMTVPSQDPLLRVQPTSLLFGQFDQSLTLSVINDGASGLTWNITSDQSWLTATPASGVDDAQVTVSVDRTGLADGVYTGTLSVFSNGGSETVSVTMYAGLDPDQPILLVSPMSFSLGRYQETALLNLSNGGGGVLEWNITSVRPWLTAYPASGTYNRQVTVSVDRTGLPDGVYTGNLSITSNGGDATVPVTMIVQLADPILQVSPLLLVFDSPYETHTFQIENDGGGTLEWTVSEDSPWVEIDPPLSGTNTATVTVRVDTSSLPEGDVNNAYVTVSSNGGSQTVTVRYVRQGNGGHIGVYSDAGGTSTEFVDSPESGRIFYIHFIHTGHSGATAVQFRMVLPSTQMWMYLGDIWSMALYIGSSITGVSVGYQYCLAPPNYLGYAIIYSNGAITTNDCEFIRIDADPTAPSGEIEVVDCSTNKLFAVGGYGVVGECHYIPVEHTTWGAIKALYVPGEN